MAISFREKLIKRMKRCGWIYNDLESAPHNLRFNQEDGIQVLPMIFKSWKEVHEWVKEIDID